MSTPTVPTPAPANPPTPRVAADHDPCCSSHGRPMTCERYRRTHFVEVRPCCAIDAARLVEEAAETPPRVGHYPITDPEHRDGALVAWRVGPLCTCPTPTAHPHGIDA